MSTVQLTGNPSIDGLLTTVKWDLTTLDFSFPQFADLYGADYGMGEPYSNFQPVNEAQKSALRYAMFYISSYTSLQFNEITETETNHGSIRFSMTSVSPSGTAHGYFPMGMPTDGDIWMTPNGGPNYTTPAIGNWGLATIMHELGHTMGLKHGHDPNGLNSTPGALPTNEDTWSYSLMTYRSYVGAPFDQGVQGPVDDGNPTTYMQNDIAALQYLYGANFNTNAGNTTYRWDPATGEFTVDGVSWGIPQSAKIFMTLWDGNGVDTYNLSAYRTNLVVNLQPGAFSTFSIAQVTDLDASAAIRLAPGNVANARLYQGDLRSLIENAIGGSGSDRITGNVGRNTLTGNGGNDILSGGSGNDTLDGGIGRDILTGGSGNDIFLFKAHRPGTTYYDKISDFNRTYDDLKLDNRYMPKLGSVGRLSSSKFVVGTKAKDTNDYLIYDKLKGYLYYDPDGTGAATKQLIAWITNKASLTYADIYVI